ncbi:hypothetical protein MJT46_001726 [Ovis ammon polii x Ovis aries]|nr:hypothetical protein MJT46_001726 [Ovis ammon polii x Ovis aries]
MAHCASGLPDPPHYSPYLTRSGSRLTPESNPEEKHQPAVLATPGSLLPHSWTLVKLCPLALSRKQKSHWLGEAFLHLATIAQMSAEPAFNKQRVAGRGPEKKNVGKNPVANVREADSIPGPGRFLMQQSNYAHVPQLLSMRFTTRGATATKRPGTTTNSSPYLPQLEKALAKQGRPSLA